MVRNSDKSKRPRTLSLLIKKAYRYTQRYGLFGTQKTKKCMEICDDILSRYDAKGTVFVPGVILQKHKNILIRFCENAIEYGIHGYSHVDYATLSFNAQRTHLAKAKNILLEFGVEHLGFRAPYGSFNKDTRKVLKELEFAFDSSPVFLHDVVKELPVDKVTLQLITSYYTPVNSSFPMWDDNVLVIPFTIPDDEILVDRIDLLPQTIEKIWNKIIEDISRRGGVFVLQLHPLRIIILKNILKNLLKNAKNLGFNIYSLGEFTAAVKKGKINSESRVFSFSGDLDAMSLMEQVWRSK